MAPRELLRRLIARPAWGCLAVALAFRLGLTLYHWHANPLARAAIMDGEYYLYWSRDIAHGDLLGTGGIAGGKPWVLNPLYAYLLAPFHLFAPAPGAALIETPYGRIAPLGTAMESVAFAVVVAQAVLGAGAAALSAASAARFRGRLAGWVAGLAVAFSTVLGQLDAHLAVAELAAFLVAGAAFACAPPAPGDSPRAHGPVVAGIWLGLGALARPVTLFALPLVAWRYARGSPAPLRAAALVAAGFFACAVPSAFRNAVVTHEFALYTGATGLNFHMGNNPDARAHRAMSSKQVRFGPVMMHEDARRRVHWLLQRPPTAAEVADWYFNDAINEMVRHPAESVGFYVHKARWFLSPTEVPSSASLRTDREFAPWIRLAFVPTWLLAAFAVAGAWGGRRNGALLLGPGALVACHWIVLTAVFPLSHYRAPAIPAMAVLGGVAAAEICAAWRERRRRAAAAILGVAVAAAAAGALPPQPDPLRMRDETVLADYYRDARDWARAESHAHDAIRAYREEFGTEGAYAWSVLGDVLLYRGRVSAIDPGAGDPAARNVFSDAADAYAKSLELEPEEVFVRLERSRALELAGRLEESLDDAVRSLEGYEFLPQTHARLGEILSRFAGREEEARAALLRARQMGFEPRRDALVRVGLQAGPEETAPPGGLRETPQDGGRR